MLVKLLRKTPFSIWFLFFNINDETDLGFRSMEGDNTIRMS